MHRNSGLICDKITSHRCPSDHLGQFLKKKKKKKMEKFTNIRTGLSRYCYKARVAFVEHSEVPEKAYIFTFAELGSF